jgi:hypothetical protein
MSLKGFPHSEIPGSKLVCSSPGLIAAYRVLHRLLAPRHSPYALSSLTTSVWTHADRLSACASRTTRMRPLFSHCVLPGAPAHVPQQSRNAVKAFCQTACSKRTTVCRIFSCQRAAERNRLLSASNFFTAARGSTFALRATADNLRLARQP